MTYIPLSPIVGAKQSSQFSNLEGIPPESKILAGVRFAFHESELSFAGLVRN